MPKAWLAEPPGKDSINYGNAWLAGKTATLLLVPSVIVHEEGNILINPAHPDATKITASVAKERYADSA